MQPTNTWCRFFIIFFLCEFFIQPILWRRKQTYRTSQTDLFIRTVTLKIKAGHYFILLTVLQSFIYISYVICTRITIGNNVYSNILVAMSPDVPDDKSIIENIKI